jgi:hypothetical protein
MPNSATPFSPGSGKAGDFGTDVVGRGGPPASFAMESFSFESAPRSRVVNSIQNLEIRTEDFKTAGLRDALGELTVTAGSSL